MSRATTVYRRSELNEMYWAECADCGNTIVVARTPDGLAHLDTVTDGGAPGETTYEPHDCPEERR